MLDNLQAVRDLFVSFLRSPPVLTIPELVKANPPEGWVISRIQYPGGEPYAQPPINSVPRT
jgi:hypothetical protein